MVYQPLTEQLRQINRLIILICIDQHFSISILENETNEQHTCDRNLQSQPRALPKTRINRPKITFILVAILIKITSGITAHRFTKHSYILVIIKD